jgi:hypothetical protein
VTPSSLRPFGLLTRLTFERQSTLDATHGEGVSTGVRTGRRLPAPGPTPLVSVQGKRAARCHGQQLAMMRALSVGAWDAWGVMALQ